MAYEGDPALAYERALAERSPLMGLPGVDPDRLEKSIKALERAAEGLASVQEDADAASAVRLSLYPFDFLGAIARLERARLAFVATGRADEARGYNAALKETVDAYTRDLDRFDESFDAHVATSDNKHVFAGKFMSPNDMKRTLTYMRSEIRAANRARILRKLCVSGLTYLCDKSWISGPAPTDVALEKTDTARILAIREIIAEIFKQPGVRQEPVFVLADSKCAGSADSAPAFILYDENMPDGIPAARRIAMVSDMRFLMTKKLLDIALYRDLSERGVEYVLASPLLHYACMHLGEDAGRVFATDAVRELASTEPLSRYAAEDSSDLVELERRLSGEIVREDDARSYLAIGQRMGTSDQLPRHANAAVSSLALAYAYKSIGLEDTLLLLAKTEILDTGARQGGVAADLAASGLFFSRSGLPLTFMTGNRSVLSHDVFPLKDAAIPASKSPYVFLSDLGFSQGSIRDIIEDSRLFVEILGHRFQ